MKNTRRFYSRDDLLEGGSKERFVDRMIRRNREGGEEFCLYGGCPANGYGKLSLAYGENMQQAVFFMAKESLNQFLLPKTSTRIWCRYSLGANGIKHRVTKAKQENTTKNQRKRRLLH